VRLENKFPNANCKRTGFILPATNILTYSPCGFDKALTWLHVMLLPAGEGNTLGEIKLLWGESRTGRKYPEPFARAL